MEVGTMELILILVVLAVVLGPKQTILYARKLGKWLRVIKAYLLSLTGELQETVMEPIEEISAPLKEMIKPLEGLADAAQDPLLSVTKSINDAVKPPVQIKQIPSEIKEEDELEYAEPVCEEEIVQESAKPKT